VIYVSKFKGGISHEVDKVGLNEGDKVHSILDWKRRYKLMRNHTAAHALAAILVKETGALITGNQLEEDKVRFDFNLENFNREIFQTYIDKANDLFKKDIPVKWYQVPREEAVKIPGVTKLANALPPNIPVLRIVEIKNLDKQADGGTHVKNLKEIGAIEMIKAKNKGKNNRRVYFRLTK
jgi:misacylated tRNA(Ala) deacylase